MGLNTSAIVVSTKGLELRAFTMVVYKQVLYMSGMEHGFLSQKGVGGQRGVKEKQHSSAIDAAKDTVVVSSPAVDEPVVADGNTKDVNVGQTPISSIVDPNLGTSYAKLFTGESSRKSVNFSTLITPARNRIDVVVPLESIRAISEWNTWGKYRLVKSMINSSTGLFFFQFSSMDGLNSMLKNGLWFIHNNPLILKKCNPDVNLLKEDVVNVSVLVKLHGVPVTAFSEDGLSAIATKLGTLLMLDSYTSDMCMQSWGKSSYVKAIIKLQADVELKDAIVDECLKNIGSDLKKNLKNPSQAPRGVPVGPKYRKEVSDLNPFDMLNSVENDIDLGTNGGTSNLASKGANSSESSFWNVGSSSISTTPIVEKIDKLEKLIIDGKTTLVDDKGKPLEKGLAMVLIVCWNKWKENHENANYDYDLYDDDMYEG
ncbi:beta-caryophyllene synthase [Tanacetum coccineum]